MNWRVTGKQANGKPGSLTIIGKPRTEAEVRRAVAGSHPGFTVERIVALDGKTPQTKGTHEPRSILSEARQAQDDRHPAGGWTDSESPQADAGGSGDAQEAL